MAIHQGGYDGAKEEDQHNDEGEDAPYKEYLLVCPTGSLKMVLAFLFTGEQVWPTAPLPLVESFPAAWLVNLNVHIW